MKNPLLGITRGATKVDFGASKTREKCINSLRQFSKRPYIATKLKMGFSKSTRIATKPGGRAFTTKRLRRHFVTFFGNLTFFIEFYDKISPTKNNAICESLEVVPELGAH